MLSLKVRWMPISLDEHSKGNRRNGKMPKQVQTRYGEITVETPRDRDGSFDPQTVKRRETILAEDMANQIINMYAFGTSTPRYQQVILSLNLIPNYLQKPSVPSQTEYCLKSSHGVHECLILYMQYAGWMPSIIR